MNQPNQFTFGTKAETLERLAPRVTRCTVPEFMYFSMKEWHADPESLCRQIAARFDCKTVIVRSSAGDEDGAEQTMAGQFESVPGVSTLDPDQIQAAVKQVAASYDLSGERNSAGDHVLVQIMIQDVVMAGVLLTQDLTTGAPYYVINYDDETGRTDTVTAGGEYSNRTLYVHRGSLGALRSTRFEALIDAAADLEQVIGSTSLDIEFAVDARRHVHLFQVRQIAAKANWNRHVVQRVDDALPPIQQFLRSRFMPVQGVRGKTSVFGQMPDWNPAEMIGRAPRPLAHSLYRHLITNSAWRVARAEMGYAEPRGQPLMASFGGQPFVDVRLSFHSYLPATLPHTIGDKLVNAWLDRIVANTHLHDKVEFDIAITALAFDFEERVSNQFPDALDKAEQKIFRNCLRDLTVELVGGKITPIQGELDKIERLAANHKAMSRPGARNDLGIVAGLLEDCIQLGTIPFSILARHAFIAQALLDSLVVRGILTADDARALLASVKTVARQFTDDAAQLVDREISRDQFMQRYGHLRPGTYDILSPRYDQRGDDFFGQSDQANRPASSGDGFKASAHQLKGIDTLLNADGFQVDAQGLLAYLCDAISAREHAKFVFTRNVSDALECIADWGGQQGLSRSELSFVSIDDLLDQLVETGPGGSERHLRGVSEEGRKRHETTVALRLPQLLYDEEGIYVVPLQLSAPNFFSGETVRGHCIHLNARGDALQDIRDGIVLIESADPGFDWIFTHGIKALVTKFGGVNSHMAIRCAEFGIPAAIGCGEQIFDRIVRAQSVEINCSEGHIRPLNTEH
jgi:phosphohistidine swiveling domain-containing protein